VASRSGDAAPRDILVGIEFAGSYGFTFAHHLHRAGYSVVRVLGTATSAWASVQHRRRLKTDAHDAITITELAAQGAFLPFAFAEPAFQELRQLVHERERLAKLRGTVLNRLRTCLQVVFPEVEAVFDDLSRPTALTVLQRFPTAARLRGASDEELLDAIRTGSNGHLGQHAGARVRAAAAASVALPETGCARANEIVRLLEQLSLIMGQRSEVDTDLVTALDDVPEGAFLLTIPGVAPLSAAVFLGCIGDPRVYHSARQVLRLAGLSLVERSSGVQSGARRLAKGGNQLLRRHMYMLAMRAVLRRGLYRSAYEQMVVRNGGRKKAAVVAAARHMLRLMFAVARDRRPFDPDPEHA
jgi:transposase